MTLLESGARALATHYGLDWDEIPQEPGFQGVHDFHCKAFWLGMSRACLEGMGPPTDAMKRAGAHAFAIGDLQLPEEVWDAMRDAALKETPK